jgi:phosphotriesterase-related protein
MARVRTITGDVAPEELGITLIHEHLLVDWGELRGIPKAAFDLGEMVERMVAAVQALRAAGGSALVDCTPIGTGRYADLMAEVAARTGLKIVASTGFFHESWAPMHPLARALDVAAMADLFAREVTEGMGATLYRAGVIKVATGKDRISDLEERVLRAAARTQRQLGVPIITHTTDGLGGEQLDILAAEGIGPEHVVISHIGSEPEPLVASQALLARGANISIDRIGGRRFADEHWVDLVCAALGAGYERQVMISHDTSVASWLDRQVIAPAFRPVPYTYIFEAFLPKLRARGVTEAQIHTMLVDNPRRVLAF